MMVSELEQLKIKEADKLEEVQDLGEELEDLPEDPFLLSQLDKNLDELADIRKQINLLDKQ